MLQKQDPHQGRRQTFMCLYAKGLCRKTGRQTESDHSSLVSGMMMSQRQCRHVWSGLGSFYCSANLSVRGAEQQCSI